MGILSRIRNGIVKGAEKAADGVALVSQLSPSQVREIDDKRNKYLSQMPSSSDANSEMIVKRNLGAIGIEVYNSYLPCISSLYLPIAEKEHFEGNQRIAYFEITKWVKDPNEDNIEKLMNVYQVLSEEECNVALVYNSKIDGCHIYLAVVNNGEEGDINEVAAYKRRLTGALKGNFPGVHFIECDEKKVGFGVNVPNCLMYNDEMSRHTPSVAIVSNLATEKSEKFVSQTIEKVLDGIVPEKQKEEYTIVLLATPIREQLTRRNRLYELYTALAPYASWQTNFTYFENDANNSSSNAAFNLGANAGCTSGGAGIVGTASRVGTDISESDIPEARTKMRFGASAGVSFARSSSSTITLGKNEGITQSFTNYGVKHILETLENQVKRLEESEALGLWDFAAYVISGDSIVANNVAHTYLALTQGEKSFFAESAVNLWRADLPDRRDLHGEKAQAAEILKAISRLQHPEFCLAYREGDEELSEDVLQYPSCVSATVSLSGKELARALNFPSKSVRGLPVIETAAFGRNVASYNKINFDVKLGNIYHMHTQEMKSEVLLSKDSFTSHVFVTGSTGVGKTNTVTGLLKKIVLDNRQEGEVTFLVVEPAKGEYKSLLGGYSSVHVYGTNPKTSEIIRINPFAFPKNVTVSEHVDRLVEIFNVCWPMYAAMPAIMKDAIIRAYESAGWDFETSENHVSIESGEELYPGFCDVMEEVKTILNSSEYSSDTKGDYVGALVSRLKSLTNGINGQIFTNNSLSDAELFDQNVIIDMSRIGAVETKSLIMGLLVLKLQEYRLSDKSPDRKRLEHITVLEEAHNLLRRTSSEQSGESANLMGKSVEMIANSIAELRAFGEGFVIADQAPGLLDMAVIRNTNTKIVHRLPEESDRILAGKAMGMTDAQISELSKLELGVAAVYQSDWIEPVLCKVDEFGKKNIRPEEFVGNTSFYNSKNAKESLMDYLVNNIISDSGGGVSLRELKSIIRQSQIRVSIKKNFHEFLNTEDGDNKFELLKKIMYELLDVPTALVEANKEKKMEDWIDKLAEKVRPSLKDYSKEQSDLVMGLLLYEQYERNASYRSIFNEFTKMYGKGMI